MPDQSAGCLADAERPIRGSTSPSSARSSFNLTCARSTFKVRPKPQAPLPLSPCSLSDRARPPHAPRAPTQPFAPDSARPRALHPARPRPGGSPRRPIPADPEEIGGRHPAHEMHAGKKLPNHTLTFLPGVSGEEESPNAECRGRRGAAPASARLPRTAGAPIPKDLGTGTWPKSCTLERSCLSIP